MEFIAATLLLRENKLDANKQNISKLLSSTSLAYSEDSMELFLQKINGQSIDKLIATGSELMKTKFAGSAQPAASSAAPSASKVEAIVEESEDSSSVVNLDLF